MKNIFRATALLMLGFALATACGSSKTTKDAGPSNIQKDMDDRNSNVIPLLTRIRRIPGVTVENGVPIFIKRQNTMQAGGRAEPLYVVDGLIVGNSYRAVRDLVLPVDVESIKGLSGADASFYGSRGANGVIIITTKRGD
jgi:TonB-dependent SusC/RagA subfamily outer membrane receptor